MVKVALIGIIVVLLALQFKGGKSEYSIYITIVGGMLIFSLGIGKLEVIMNTIEKIKGYLEINGTYMVILLKMVGITYIAEFASNLCKDAGYGSISNQIEMVGKLTILSMSMPIITALLEIVHDVLKG